MTTVTALVSLSPQLPLWTCIPFLLSQLSSLHLSFLLLPCLLCVYWYLMNSYQDRCLTMMAIWDHAWEEKAIYTSVCTRNFQLTFFFDYFPPILRQFYLLYWWQANAIATGSTVSSIYTCSWMISSDLHA